MSPHAPSAHAPHAPSIGPTRGKFLRSKRSKPLIGALVLALAGGAAGLTVAMRDGSEAAAQPVSDVPRREGAAIVVSDAFRATSGIETVAAASVPLVPQIDTVGAVQFDPTHVAAVGTRAAGIVTKVFHVEGDFVKEGDLLAEIESGGLAGANADLQVALAKQEAATLNAERERQLIAKQLTTAREREQAESALKQQKALVTAARERVDALGGGRGADTGVSQLRAPLSGVIAERAIAPGQSIGASLVAFRVGDVDQLWVLLRIFERHIGLVSVGDVAEVRTLSEPPRTITGKVVHVGAVVDPSTRTTDIRVAVPNGERVLLPGQAVSATIRANGPARAALSVPSSAVTYVDGKPTVFVATTPTRFEPRAVELGIEGGLRVEITSGVREGEQVVAKNVIAIKSELFR